MVDIPLPQSPNSAGAGNYAGMLQQGFGDIGNAAWEGNQRARQLRLQGLFRDGLPTLPNGQPDLGAASSALLKSGGADFAKELLPFLYNLNGQQSFFNMLGGGGGGGGQSGQTLPSVSGGTGEPASIRTNNPGAQWAGDVAGQYGATGKINLPGGNNAAVFPDKESGAAAQFALLDKGYTGKTLGEAIKKWSGGNDSRAYADSVSRATGLPLDTKLTHDVLAGPQGIKLAQAMARVEAGREYPMSDEQWGNAQRRAFGNPMATVSPGSEFSVPAGSESDAHRYDMLAAKYNLAAAMPGVTAPQSAAAKAEAERYSGLAKEIRSQAGKYYEPTDTLREFAAGRRGGEDLGAFEARRAGEKEGATNEASETGKMLQGLAEKGLDARAHSALINSVAELGEKVPYGIIPKIQSELGKYGVETKGLSDIQSYEAAISYLAPQLRPVGSGRLLQNELSAFKASLGGLMVTPEGRRISLENLKLLSNFQEQVGSVAANTNIPAVERMKLIYQIPPPRLKTMEDVQQGRGSGGYIPQQTSAQQNPQTGQWSEGQTATNPRTGQRIILRGGQWVPAQ